MRRELTWQAVVSAFLVSALVAAAYPYVVLKLGMGPNVSVVSAFLGALLLTVLAGRTRGQNRLMNNVVQTAGTSAAQTAFMCVVAAAVDLALDNPVIKDKLIGIPEDGIHPWPMFLWLTCAGGIGVLFTVLFRRHFLDDPKMVFADGVAAAETIIVLDTPGREAKDKMAVLGICGLASALVDWLREGPASAVLDWLRKGPAKLADIYPSPGYAAYKAGIEWNLLTVGSGLLIGLNVSLSMMAATLVVANIGPYLIDKGIGREIVLSEVAPEYRDETARIIQPGRKWNNLTTKEHDFIAAHGGKRGESYLKGDYFNVVLLWFMWPATGMMITAAVTAVLLQWRSVVRSFVQLRERSREKNPEDVSLRTIVVWCLLLTAALAVVQRLNFHMSYLQTAVAVVCSLPLILVGITVLGETNNGPISVMMNGLQAVFAAFWSGSVGHNLVAAGMAGTCNAQGQGTIQDYKTGKLVGSTPRVLTWVQLAAVPIGAAAVAIMYPVLKTRYTLGTSALPAPTAIKIANMAALLSRGAEAFPEGALLWTVIASIAGIVLTLGKHFLRWGWLPSASGFGFGLILPGTLNLPIAIGGVFGWLWEKVAKPSYDRYVTTVASGLIAGEALLGGLVIPIMAWWEHAQR